MTHHFPNFFAWNGWLSRDVDNLAQLKTHGGVSAAKKVMWHTSVLFTGTASSPFSTPHISITTGPISVISRILCPPYARPYIPSLKEIDVVVYEICVHEIAPFSSHFSSSHQFTKVILSQPKTPFSWINFFQIWHNHKALCGLS